MIKILTFYYNRYGYGALLQSYGLSSIIFNNGYQNQQISLNYMHHNTALLSRIKNVSINKILSRLITVFHIFQNSKLQLKLRKACFCRFMNAISHSNIYNSENIANCVNNDDIFIAGSDQIWNPSWTEDAYFLNFVPDHNGKIAYAASIGMNEVPQAFIDHVVPYLNRFDFISVREESAKRILQPYVSKEIKVVLDPTLLLSREEWDKVAAEPSVPEPYMFVYLLGEKRGHRRLIKKFAAALGLKIVFIPHIHFRFNPADCFFADYNLYDVGPAEFVGLIKNAEMVVTDSFHGCVFSIIYRRKFWALKRHKDSDPQNMNSRLYTLFDSLGLRDRLIEDENVAYDADWLNRRIDYAGVEAKLNVQREESTTFLLDAIKTVQARMASERNQDVKENSK